MADVDHDSDVMRALIRRLWDEGDFVVDDRHGPGQGDGLMRTVEFSDDELAVLAEVVPGVADDLARWRESGSAD